MPETQTRTRLPSPKNASQLHVTLNINAKCSERKKSWSGRYISILYIKDGITLRQTSLYMFSEQGNAIYSEPKPTEYWRWKNSNWRQTAETATRATTRGRYEGNYPRGVSYGEGGGKYYKYCKWKISCNEINEPNAGKCLTCAVNFSKVFNQHTRAQTSL